jgi:hypothetical protein
MYLDRTPKWLTIIRKYIIKVFEVENRQNGNIESSDKITVLYMVKHKKNDLPEKNFFLEKRSIQRFYFAKEQTCLLFLEIIKISLFMVMITIKYVTF